MFSPAIVNKGNKDFINCLDDRSLISARIRIPDTTDTASNHIISQAGRVRVDIPCMGAG